MSTDLRNPVQQHVHTRSSGMKRAETETETGVSSQLVRRDIPAWGISLIVHLLICIVLLSITRAVQQYNESVIFSAIEEEDNTEQDEYVFDATMLDKVGNNSDLNLTGPSQDAAEHVKSDPVEETKEQIQQEMEKPDIALKETVNLPQESEFVASINVNGATETPGGVEGAIDRLAFEIAGSLKERKTLVVWMLDASLSQQARREAIAERIDNVYNQLGLLNADPEKALKTGVVSFGQKLTYLTKEPVNGSSAVSQAIRSVTNDNSGKEYVFSAINDVAKKWLHYRSKERRNIMFIIVTDERGDDYDQLEPTILKLKRNGIKCYCVGNASLFGREKGYVSWTYDDGTTEPIPVDQGPETVAAERVQLAFWGESGRGLRNLSAGFGPYALTRLCGETGGVFFIANQGKITFDFSIMRDYAPDYRPIRVYQNELKTNLAKQALVQAATVTASENVPVPALVFRAENDNILRLEITEAQKPMAEIDYKFDEILRLIMQGEKDRKKLKSPRWRASFDLAMGRTAAMRVRAFGYNSMLAEMKATPKSFKKPGGNQWKLVSSKDINSGPTVRKLAKKANEFLNRVVEEHPGTPWALLAQRELSQPLGWAWEEAVNPFANPNIKQNTTEEQVRLLLAEEERQRRMKRKKTTPRKRPTL